MTRRRLTEERRLAADQARRETVEALHRQLAERVGSLDNRAEWEHYLAFARSFHQYSFGNRLLIMLQAPEATAVASYRAWQAKGYQVRRGEKAIRVLGPVTKRVPVLDDAGNQLLDAEGKPREARKLVGVTPVSVFDTPKPTDRLRRSIPSRCCSPGKRHPAYGTASPPWSLSEGSGWNAVTVAPRTDSPCTTSVWCGSGPMWTTRRRSSRWPTNWGTS